MTFLFDTNALSEPGRRTPDAGFAQRYAGVETHEVFLSALSLGELRRGVSLLDAGDQRRRLEALYTNIVHRFAAQVLPIDATVAEAWGELSARLQRAGRVIGAPDELIAATALVHGLKLVTRNARHFAATGCTILSPWSV